MKVLFVIYADPESLLEQICKYCVLGRTRTVLSCIIFSHFSKFQKVHIQIPHILPHLPNINVTPFHTNNNF